MLKSNGLPCGNLGILNIYAPNNPIDHCNLWELMKVEIFGDSNQLFCEDFNMLKQATYKSSSCNRFISDKERFFWEALKVVNWESQSDQQAPKGISNTHETTKYQGINKSWQGQIGCTCLVTSNGVNHVTYCSAIKGDGVRFDHHLISQVGDLKTTPKWPSKWKMNTLHFEKAKDQIYNIWQTHLVGISFFTKLGL